MGKRFPSRYVAAVLVATVITTAIIIPIHLYVEDQQSHSLNVKVEQNQARSQEDIGLLAEWINATWPYLQTLVETIGIVSAFQWAWNQISGLFTGRPDFGPGSATWCDAEFFGYSRNGFVKNLGTSFIILQREGASLSSSWWLFTDKANKFCTDLENRCGYSTGSSVCQQYLYLALNWNNACSNWVPISLLSSLDNSFPQCF